MNILNKTKYEQELIKMGQIIDVDKTQLTKDEFLKHIQTIALLANRNFRNDKMIKTINHIITNYDQNRQLSISFKITENKARNLYSALDYNSPYTAYYELIKFLQKKLPNHDIVDDLDRTLFFRTDRYIKKRDYDLIHFAMSDFKSMSVPVISASKINVDGPAAYEYSLSYKFVLYYAKGKSILDLNDYSLKFFILLSLFHSMEKNGFSLERLFPYRKRTLTSSPSLVH